MIWRIIGPVALVASLGGAVWWLSGRVDSLKAQLAVSDARLRSAKATINLIRTERESDAAIDAIPDIGGAIPDRWLHPAAPR